MACLAAGVRGVEGNEPPLGPQTEAMGRQGLERCLGPPSSTKVALGLPWPSSVPVVTAGLQRPLGLPPPPPPRPRLPDALSAGRQLAKGPQTASLIYQAPHVSRLVDDLCFPSLLPLNASVCQATRPGWEHRQGLCWPSLPASTPLPCL